MLTDAAQHTGDYRYLELLMQDVAYLFGHFK